MRMLVRVALAACACACALALPAASPPTQDPLVVTRDDAAESSTPAADAPTTQAPQPPLKLTQMDVSSEVSMRYAHTAIVTQVRNAADKSQETVFRVLLPETAFISGFQMTINGVTYKAFVKGKEEAKQIYDKAVSEGLSAGHVAVKARDSNEFVTSVNLEPKSTAVFNLTYEELLVRRNGVYNHDINLHPGALVPALTVRVHVREAQALTALRVPELRTGNEIDATDSDPSNSLAVIERSADNREATITFKPDIEEQKRLMQVYAEKSKESQQQSRRYYEDKSDVEGVLGQFVVQYDVKRPKNGEILVNDGYFVYFFAPEELPPLKKFVVFVLDTSGSMMDRKIQQLREAMQAILSELNEGDYFSIVEFNSGVMVHDLKEADQEPPKQGYSHPFFGLDNKPAALVPPAAATPDNISKAKVIVSRLVASGGTNIDGALNVAINIVRKGVPLPPGPSEPGRAGATGGTGATGATDPTAHSSLDYSTNGPVAPGGTTEEPETNYGDNEEKQEMENMIVFLTDGDPTVGETDPRRITNHITEKNAGRATIFSLAFGEDADRAFLRKMSLRNGGFSRHIYEAADAALQLRDFYRQITSPLLDDVTFSYPPEQVKEGTLTKHKFRTYFAGSEVVVAGQLKDDATELTPQVSAFCGVEDGVGKKRYEISPKVPVSRQSGQVGPLERLWVYLTIRQLLDEKDAADPALTPHKDDDPEKKAKDLALKYELVTPLTSLVVVKPNATNAVDAQSVDEQSRPLFGAPLAAQSFAAFPSGAGGVAFASFSHALTTPYVPLALFEDELAVDEDGQYDIVPGMPVMPARLAFSSVARRGYLPASLNVFDSGKTAGAGVQFRPSLPGASGPVGRPGQPGGPGQPGAPGQPGRPVPQAPQPPAGKPAADQNAGPGAPVAADPLQAYHLENYNWVKPLLDTSSDALVLTVNGTSINLKLTKEDDAPKSASDAACARATDGGAGLCVYLTRCAAAEAISAQLYADVYCAVDASSQSYAGVCCPSGSVSPPAPSP